jgi:osmoprotectant transport system substrate-binding protein
VRLSILIAGAACAGLVTTLAACGSPTVSANVKTVNEKLKGATFVVGSKDFTESILLGKITEDLLKAHGATVIDKTNIAGSVNTRTALTSGQIGMYWEYTGTAWIDYLKHTKPIPDPQQQFAAVKQEDAKNGIAWLDPAPLNDTYAMATRAGESNKLGVHFLSDLARLAKTSPSAATFCIESEFSTRSDGFPGMVKAYGINVPKSNVKLLDTGAIYPTTAKGKVCNFGEVFTTDGRVSALKLNVLTDNKHFFPNYNAALTMKLSTLHKYPVLASIINPVAAKLNNATMTKLNAEVDVQGLPADQAAATWLTNEGFLK